DRVLAVGVPPALEEGIQTRVAIADGPARVVAQALRNELAVLVQVLNALGDHHHRYAPDVVPRPALPDAMFRIVSIFLEIGPGLVGRHTLDGGIVRQPQLVRWGDRVVTLRDVDGHRIAVEVWIGEQLRRLLEVHDGERELAVVLVDARTPADDLLELGHR